MLLFGRLAEVFEALVPELEPAGDGDDAQRAGGCVGGLEQADVVGDDAVAAALEAGGEGGFSGSGVAEEGDDAAGVLDRAGVQGEQAVLVAERAEDGAEEVGGDVGDGGAGGEVDADFVAVAHVVAGGVRDVEQVFGGGDLGKLP